MKEEKTKTIREKIARLQSNFFFIADSGIT